MQRFRDGVWAKKSKVEIVVRYTEVDAWKRREIFEWFDEAQFGNAEREDAW